MYVHAWWMHNETERVTSVAAATYVHHIIVRPLFAP